MTEQEYDDMMESSRGTFCGIGVSIQQDAETKTLTIRMKYSSDVYEYEGVPEEVYQAFLEAESKGGFFATEIQYKYPTVRH